MKNLSESNKKIISELVTDLETYLIDNKKQCHSAPTNEDIEKEIDEIVVFLLKERGSHQTVGRSRSKVTVGTNKSAASVGRMRGTSRFDSSGMATYASGAGERGLGAISTPPVNSDLGSQNINPRAMTAFRRMWNRLEAQGYEPFVTSGQRMPSHQRQLYDSGQGYQTAQPCISHHQYGYALDINVHLPKEGTPPTSPGRLYSQSSDAAWKPVVDIAEKEGIAWQGSGDRVHFYLQGTTRTDQMRDDCIAFYDGIDINSRNVAAAMEAKEEENPVEINRILKIA